MTDPNDSIEPEVDVTVNGRAYSVPAFCTMADLVERLEHAPDSIATAANGEFITRNRRSAYVLCLGDQIDLFQPIVGG